MVHKYQKLKTNSNTHIKNIYHMADIHIRLDTKRHTEYREVFNRVYDLLRKETEESIVVLCGDILHSKTELSPECVSLTVEFMKNLANIMDVIVIMGNHDGNLANTSKLDSLTPLISEISSKYNIYYLLETGIYEYKNIAFGVTSVLDDNKEDKNLVKASDIKTRGLLKIALYHGPVNGSVTDVGFRMNNTELTTNKFRGYHYVLLGDIHRFQYLNEKKTICYPSSLIQQNWGEDIQNHGLIKWDLINKTSEFIKIHNDYGYCTLNVKNGILDNIIEIPQKPRIRLMLENTSKSQYLEIYNMLKNKYNIQEITYSNVSTNDISSENETPIKKIQDLSNSSYQATLITKYINDQFKMDDKQIQDIIKLNEEFNKQINLTTDKQFNKWKIKELQFSNMFCYGEDNKINFETQKGVIGLLGKNHCGKSSIIDVILFTLFDKCSRGSRTDVLNEKKESFSCKLILDISGIEYIITRIGKKPKLNAKNIKIDVDFKKKYVNKKKNIIKYINLNGKDRNETNKKISEYIGSYDDYIMTSFCLQKETNFIDYPQKDKKNFLMRLLKLDVFELLLIEAKSKLKEKDVLYKNLLKETKKSDNCIIKNKIIDCQKKREELIIIKNNLDKTIEKCNNDIDKYRNSVKNIQKPNDTNLQKYTKNKINLEKKYNELEVKYKEKQKLLENKIKEHTKLKEKLDSYNVNKLEKDNKIFVNKTKKEIEKLTLKLTELNRSIKQTQKFEYTENYYISELNKSNDKLELLNKNIEEYKNKIINLQEKIIKIDNNNIIKQEQYNELNEQYIRENKQLQGLIKDIKIMEEKLDKLSEHEYDPNCKFCINNIFVKDAQNTKDKIKITQQNLDKISTSCTKLEAKLKQLKKIMDQINNNKKIENDIYNLQLKLNLYEKDFELKTSQKDKIVNIISEYEKDRDNIKHNEQIDIEIKDIQEELNKLNNKKFKQYEKYLIEKNNYEEIDKQLTNDKLIILNMEAERRDLTDKINECNKIIEDIEKYNTDKNINNKILNKIEILKNTITNKKEELNDINEKLSILSSEIVLLDRDKIDYEKNMSKLLIYEDELKVLNNYIKIIDKNGLPFSLLINIIPEIQKKVNNILSSLTEFNINIELLEDNSIKITKNVDNYSHDIELCSGFEKFIVGLAIRVTLTQMANLSCCNLMIIDEGFSCLDSTNQSNLDSLFGYLREWFDFVIIISHLQTMKGMCDNILNIKIEKGGFSNIYYE